MNITRNLITAVLMTIVTTLLLGVLYPLAITGIAQVVFPDQANGQLIERNGRSSGRGSSARASRRPGTSARGRRPPARATTRPIPAGSNLGPTNKKLIDAVTANVEAARKENPTRRCRSIS